MTTCEFRRDLANGFYVAQIFSRYFPVRSNNLGTEFSLCVAHFVPAPEQEARIPAH